MCVCVCRVVSDVVAGIVVKCLNGRPKTKEGGIMISLMFIEIEQFAIVQVGLLYTCTYYAYLYSMLTHLFT